MCVQKSGCVWQIWWHSIASQTPFALFQALIQYPDPVAANNAKTALEGHAIYDGGYNRVCDPSLPLGSLAADIS